MAKVLTIDGRRDAYSIEQIINYCHTMTVGELIDILENYDSNMLVMINNDNGYTYGKISEYESFRVEETDIEYETDDDDDEDDDEEDDDE